MDKKQPPPPKTPKDNRLAQLVSNEARISRIEERTQPNPELISAGWKRRFFTDSHRAAEMVNSYKALGFEVHLEPLSANAFNDDCEGCKLLALLKFVTIYTRFPEENTSSS